MEFSDFLIHVLIAIGVFIVLFLLFAGLMIYLLVRKAHQFLDKVVMADPAVLQRRLERLRERHPQLSQDDLVRKVIHHQARLCGLVGFVTGFGGLPLLPLMVPLDLAVSLRLQASMVQFIALAYGRQAQDRRDQKVQTYLIMAGSEGVINVTSRLLEKLLLKVAAMSFLRAVPLLGGIVGLITNWMLAQAAGRLAIRWYNGDLRELTGGRVGAARAEAVALPAEPAAP